MSDIRIPERPCTRCGLRDHSFSDHPWLPCARCEGSHYTEDHDRVHPEDRANAVVPAATVVTAGEVAALLRRYAESLGAEARQFARRELADARVNGRAWAEQDAATGREGQTWLAGIQFECSTPEAAERVRQWLDSLVEGLERIGRILEGRREG